MNNIKHLSHPRGGVLKQRQRGLSMIELMIAITLSLILTTGIIQLFVSNKRANQLQQGTNSLQENGRYAMKLLIDSLHGADHWGGVEADEVGGSPALTGIGSCNTAWINNVAEGIRGYEGAAVSPLPNACIAAADYVPNSDVFVVRHAGGEYQSTAAVTGGAGSDAWVRSAVGRRARLFQAANIASLPSDLYDAGDPDAVGLYNYPYLVSAYFIRPCSGKAGAACAATDDNGRPVPTLARLSLVNGQLTEQALVNGVEQMQIEYGVDTDQDLNADFYDDADTITANSQWNGVVSVRLTLVVRSEEVGKLADTTNYNLPGGNVYTPPASAQYYPRKIFTSVVQVRNRSRS